VPAGVVVPAAVVVATADVLANGVVVSLDVVVGVANGVVVGQLLFNISCAFSFCSFVKL
jgi:hypothetical protein